MRDTGVEAAAIQIAAFRRLTPAQRVALAFDASEWVMAIARARNVADTPSPADRSLPSASPTDLEPRA